jgi:hypothetical protein
MSDVEPQQQIYLEVAVEECLVKWMERRTRKQSGMLEVYRRVRGMNVS